MTFLNWLTKSLERFRFVRMLRVHRTVRRAAKSGKSPVLVYQMGKVSSSSVAHSIMKLKTFDVFQVHHISKKGQARLREMCERSGQRINQKHHFELGSALGRHVINAGLRAKVITMVREPVSRNISAYYENLDRIWNLDEAHRHLSFEQLAQGFLERFQHEMALSWFDEEFNSTLGVNIYRHRFPEDKGYLTFSTDRFDVLLFRHDLEESKKERKIAQLLGVSKVPMIQSNMAKDKRYAESYREFRKRLKLPSWYLDKMLGAKYTRHFFSTEKIEQIRERWQAA